MAEVGDFYRKALQRRLLLPLWHIQCDLSRVYSRGRVQLYDRMSPTTRSVSDDRMAAEGAMLIAILSHAADRSGLRAD